MSGYVAEWPKTLYRPAPQGGLEHRSFASEADVPANDGWTDHKSAKAAAKPEPAPVTKTQAGNAKLEAKIAELEQKIIGLRSQASADRIAADESRAALNAAQARTAEVETFLEALMQDENCPDALKAAIKDLLEPAPAKQARAIKAAEKKREKPADKA